MKLIWPFFICFLEKLCIRLESEQNLSEYPHPHEEIGIYGKKMTEKEHLQPTNTLVNGRILMKIGMWTPVTSINALKAFEGGETEGILFPGGYPEHFSEGLIPPESKYISHLEDLHFTRGQWLKKKKKQAPVAPEMF